MPAPSGTVWGSENGSGETIGKIGLYVLLNSTNTETTVNVEIWFWTKYRITDNKNAFYYGWGQTADVSIGSKSLSHQNSGAWNTSNQTKIGTYTKKYTRTKSSQTQYFTARYTGLEAAGGSGSVQKSFSIPSLPIYTVSYNANGGSGAPSSQTKTYGETLTLTTSKPARTGYVFKNWNTRSDGSGTTYNSGGYYTGNSGITLYAIWTPANYTLTLNGNGGTPSTKNVALTYNSGNNNSISSYTPTLAGHTFLGWYTSASGGTQVYNKNGMCTNDGTYWKNNVYVYAGNITLYAHWQINTYIVKFDASTNGGSVNNTGVYEKAYTYNTVLGNLPVAVKTNYKFLGWFTSASGGTQATSNLKVTGNVYLYAQFKLEANCYQKDKTYKRAMMYYKKDGKYRNCIIKVKKNRTYKDVNM